MAQEPVVPTLLCTDEDIAVHAIDDFAVLATKLPRIAYGTDGALAANAWVLTSASVNFQSYGAASNQIVVLQDKVNFRGGGELLAVDIASSGGATLRWPGQAANVGQPPGPPAGATSVTFTIRTFASQIEAVSYELYQRYGIDPNIAWRAPSWAYDLRVLQRACILMVLYRRYASAVRTKEGDFAAKVAQTREDLDAALDLCQLRWGPTGVMQPSSTIFGMRLSR